MKRSVSLSIGSIDVTLVLVEDESLHTLLGEDVRTQSSKESGERAGERVKKERE